MFKWGIMLIILKTIGLETQKYYTHTINHTKQKQRNTHKKQQKLMNKQTTYIVIKFCFN